MTYINKKKIFYLLLLILVICIFSMLYFGIKSIETYEQNYEKINTVCLVWSNKKNNKTNHGFGDKIRGLIYVHRYFKSKNNNINIIVDATNDICGDILKNVKSTFTNIINDVKINYITKE